MPPITPQNDELLATLAKQLHVLEQRKQYLLDETAVVELSIKRVQADHGRLVNQASTIARLPNELMGQIFLAGQQEQVERYTGRPSRSSPPFELLVSHTSSHFRDIALSTPPLWTHVVSWPWAKRESEMGRISAYLARSKACPIDIDACLDDDDIVAMLGQNIARWRRVYIEALCQYDLEKILTLVRHSSAPYLEQLSVCPEHMRVRSTSGFPWDVFSGGAPALTFVRLTGVAIQVLQPPLHTVTTLLLEVISKAFSIPYARFCDIIASAPALVNLSLYGIVVEPWPIDHPPSFNIPALSSFRIKAGPPMLQQLLSAIHAPELESLVIADCADEDPSSDPSWDYIQSRPDAPKFPKLHSLTLIDCFFAYRNCKTLFRKLPTITHFSLLGSFNVDILKGLGDDCQLSSDLAWTRLHTLTIERLETVQESLLCTSVLSGRKQLGRPISVLRLESQLRNKFKRKGRLGWLEQVVSVERWCDPEPWPPGLDFVDIHDVFP